MPAPGEHSHIVQDTLGSRYPVERLRVDVGARSDRGRVREANEDAYVVLRLGRFLERVASNVPEPDIPPRSEDAGYLMLVADGLGGHAAGEVASHLALASMLQRVLLSPRWAIKLDDPESREIEIRALLVRARSYLAGAHQAVREQAAVDARLAGMGTTLTGGYLVRRDLFVLHVGDSKAYRLRAGRLERITRDHTVAQDYADAGMIPQEQVPEHRMNHVLTRAVGGPHEDLEGDTYHLSVEAGDRLLFCSDGLTGGVTEAEIAAVLGRHPESQSACDALVELALERGGRDNITVIVAGLSRE